MTTYRFQREFGDEPEVGCALCGRWMSAALWAEHMAVRHDLDSRLLTEQMADAAIVDKTEEE